MKTVADTIRGRVEAFGGRASDFLRQSCSIYRWNEPGSSIFTFKDYGWRELDTEARRTQSDLLREYHRLAAILEVLLGDEPSTTSKVLTAMKPLVEETLSQNSRTAFKDVNGAADALNSVLADVLASMDNLPDPLEGLTTMIPDTNALILSPSLDRWRFDDASTFRILLTPTVLQELDELKLNHRVEGVRDKAKSLIRQIKEFRRRGRLSDGVTLTKGISSLAAIAVEPRLRATLPWLDLTNNDDRLLASVTEVMRQRLRSPVSLVTADINLQNKADYAEIPYIEPPEIDYTP